MELKNILKSLPDYEKVKISDIIINNIDSLNDDYKIVLSIIDSLDDKYLINFIYCDYTYVALHALGKIDISHFPEFMAHLHKTYYEQHESNLKYKLDMIASRINSNILSKIDINHFYLFNKIIYSNSLANVFGAMTKDYIDNILETQINVISHSMEFKLRQQLKKLM